MNKTETELPTIDAHVEVKTGGWPREWSRYRIPNAKGRLWGDSVIESDNTIPVVQEDFEARA